MIWGFSYTNEKFGYPNLFNIKSGYVGSDVGLVFSDQALV